MVYLSTGSIAYEHPVYTSLRSMTPLRNTVQLAAHYLVPFSKRWVFCWQALIITDDKQCKKKRRIDTKIWVNSISKGQFENPPLPAGLQPLRTLCWRVWTDPNKAMGGGTLWNLSAMATGPWPLTALGINFVSANSFIRSSRTYHVFRLIVPHLEIYTKYSFRKCSTELQILRFVCKYVAQIAVTKTSGFALVILNDS